MGILGLIAMMLSDSGEESRAFKINKLSTATKPMLKI
jgi:hypothetical protein